MDEIVTTTREPGHDEKAETVRGVAFVLAQTTTTEAKLTRALIKVTSEHPILDGIPNEELLEAVLARLADAPDRGAAIAQSAVEEALRQLRKRERRACG